MSSNNRASLLAGLRTGGVRQPSQMPFTAAPSVTSFPRAELPMTASIGGSFNQIIPPQAHAHSQAQAQAQQQAFQMQMMQMEILRLQAIQQAQQQYQLELVRQQQLQHQQQAVPNRRISQQYAEMPHSAVPGVTTFASNRRASQAEQLKSQLHLNSRISQEEQQVPMTASLGGRFGGRLNPNAVAFRMGVFPEEEEMASNQRQGNNGLTTVISGGTPLGSSNGNGAAAGTGMAPSKSDTSLNWRRGGNNNSVLSGNRAASVSVRVTPPPGERDTSPLGHLKSHRPEPLRFSVLHEAPSTPLVIVDNSDGEDGDDGTSTSSSKSEPTTPPSGGVSDVPLSPREMASKRLYEGLGIGRPVPQSAAVHTLSFPGTKAMPHTSVGLTFANRIVSQPSRQPRGPPSGDELGTKNFASRIRRKAIGGLGAMLDARVNRQEIEAF
ncbi:hypothetical protein ACEPAF_6904 [Sanghuangporus sanghuang]